LRGGNWKLVVVVVWLLGFAEVESCFATISGRGVVCLCGRGPFVKLVVWAKRDASVASDISGRPPLGAVAVEFPTRSRKTLELKGHYDRRKPRIHRMLQSIHKTIII
jgi:hypothetical protein